MPTRFNRRLRHQRQHAPSPALHFSHLTPNGISVTPTAPPPRGLVPSAVLQFSGLAENPGHGAWAIVCSVTVSKPDGASNVTVFESSGPLGMCTRNVAEYMALLAGLRALVRHLQTIGCRADIASVEVRGESDTVISQMQGVMPVLEPRLQVIQYVVKSVQRQFGAVSYSFGDDCEEVRSLAQVAREMDVRDECKAVYTPSVLGLAKAKVGESETLATHDLGSAGYDRMWFIDAAMVQKVGTELLQNVRDAYPLGVVMGRVRMNVLGVIDLDVGVRLGKWAGGRVCCVVVDDLPVPLHCSVRGEVKLVQDGEEVGIRQLREIAFEPKKLEDKYAMHEFWTLEGPEG